MTLSRWQVAGHRPWGIIYGTSAQVPKTIAQIWASHKLEVHGGEGCKAGAFPPYVYSTGFRNEGPFLKDAFWLNRLSTGTLNHLSLCSQ